MKFVLMAVTPLLGIMIFVVGLVFGIFFVGVPYPDAPPALQAQYDFRMSVAETISLTGGAVLLIGLALVPVIALATRKKETDQ